MKIILPLILTTVFLGSAISQTQLAFIDYNNVRTLLSNRGSLGFNPQTSGASYEVPIGSSNHVLYAHTPLWTATDGNGNLKGGLSGYNLEATMHGPISNNYNSMWQVDNRAIFTVSYAVVQNHIANYNQSGYVVPPEISNWPAEGNVAESGSAFLAPFEDVNFNGVYDPENGDYPIIYGDQMSFTIFNYDSIPNPSLSNIPSTPLEVQMGAYQYFSNDEINDVTFVYYRVENKSEDTLYDFRWGNMADFDIGFAEDDYIGSDVGRNLVYAYNATNNDQGGNGSPGYGANPPAAGIISLNNTMDVSNYYGSGGSFLDYNITSLSDLRNIMQGNNNLGVQNTDNDGNTVKMLFNETPNVTGSYSEYQQGNLPGDRRVLYSSESYDLKPGESKCYHYAIIYKRTFVNDNIEIVDSLLTTADKVQAFFSTQVAPNCYQKPTVSLEENENLDEGFNLYPNPANENIQLKSSAELEKILILDYSGKIVQEVVGTSKILSISNLSKGIYFVQVVTSKGNVLRKRFVKN